MITFGGRQTHRVKLIPSSSIAGRSLITIVAILTYLAVLSAGCAVLINDSSRRWSNRIASEMTIQVKPQIGRNIDDDVASAAKLASATSGVGSVRVFSKEDSAGLLEPWLGKGLNLDDLPVPRLIVVRPAGGHIDAPALVAGLKQAVPNAVLDDHRLWYERLNAMANTLVLIALGILSLVLTAMALAIVFATRGAMAGTKDIIDVLHFVGAHDRFISREFQGHFFKQGLRGASIGGILAVITFMLAGSASSLRQAGPEREQVESLFGSFSLGWTGYLAMIVLAFLVALLVGHIARTIVFRHLQSIR